MDKGLKWEMIKYELRQCTIEYSKARAKETKQNFINLSQNVTTLEKALSENPTEEIAQQYQNVKDELEQLVTQKAQSSAFRARADWVEHGEKNTKFFTNLEKKNHNKKNHYESNY